MFISFDPAKDIINQNKHGISLASAECLEWDEALSEVDDSLQYDEIRMKGFVPMGNILYCVIYTDRKGDERRVISLRQATVQEVRFYVLNH